MSPRATFSLPGRPLRVACLALLAAAAGLLPGLAPAATSARQAPVALRTVMPVHPPELRQKLVNGEVVLECLVDTEGRASEVKVISESHPGFAAAAEEALLQWEFRPAENNGQPVPMRIRVPFEFRLSTEQMLTVIAGRPIYEEVRETVIPAMQLPAWPRPLQFYVPRYPPELEGSGKYGKAVVNITINQEGKVINPRLVKATYPEFALPALLTALQLQFPPQVMANGDKIYVNLDLQFDFKAPAKDSKAAEAKKKK